MGKKKQFTLAAILITGGYYLSHYASFSWRYQAILGLILFSLSYLFVLFFKVVRNWKRALTATLLPTLFILGISLFYFIFSQDLITRLVLTAIFGLGVYTLISVENIFLVSSNAKVVPLYRAASTVALIISLITAFFLFDVIFSFKLSSIFNFLMILAASFFLFKHFFWIIDLSVPDSDKNSSFVVVFSLLLAQTGAMLSFLPIGVTKGSLFLVSLFYICGGVGQAYRQERLFKKTQLEFVYLGVGIFLALIFLTSWRGRF